MKFNEGSLLRRTLLHVGTFVLGTVAFIGLLSFTLVTVAKGLIPSATAVEPEAAPAAENGDAPAATTKPTKPRRKKPAAAPAVTVEHPN